MKADKLIQRKVHYMHKRGIKRCYFRSIVVRSNFVPLGFFYVRILLGLACYRSAGNGGEVPIHMHVMRCQVHRYETLKVDCIFWICGT
jgi:hypothetical protein